MNAQKFILAQIKKSFIPLALMIFIVLVLIPLFYRQYIEYQECIVNMIKHNNSKEAIIKCALALIATQAIHEIFWRIRDAIKILLSTQSRFNGASESINLIMKNNFRFFENNNISAVVANTRQVSENTERIIVAGVKILSSIGYVCIILFSIFEKDIESFFIVVFSIAFYTLVASLIFIKASRLAAKASSDKDKFLIELYNTFINMPVIFVYNTFDKEKRKIIYRAQVTKKSETYFELALLSVWIMQAMLFTWLMWKLITLMVTKNKNTGVVISVIVLMRDFFGKMWSLAQDISEIIENYGRLSNGLLHILPNLNENSCAEYIDLKNCADQSQTIIRLEGVEFKMGDNTIRFPNLEIKQNETIVLIGSSGSGKSTMAEIILGLTKPNKGIIYSNFIDRTKIIYLPQNAAVFNDTLRQNLLYGIQEENNKNLILDSEIYSILSNQIFEFIFKRNLDTHISNSELSEGEIQKICLGRALIRDKIFGLSLSVLDEPTSALDLESQKCATQIIRDLKGAKLVITHQSDTKRLLIPDKVVELKGCGSNGT